MTIIDVSFWNGRIDWPRVRAAGVTRVYIRGPIGSRWRDDNFAANWKGASAAGIPRRGIYCDVMTGEPAQAAVANILKVTGGDFGTEPLALDVERTKDERAAGFVFPKAAYTAMLKGIVDGLGPLVRVEIYTSKVEWEAMTTSPAWALGLLHWLAHYNDHIAEPDRPAGWDWDLWQYGQAPVDGIEHPVDVSREKARSVPMATLLDLAVSATAAALSALKGLP